MARPSGGCATPRHPVAQAAADPSMAEFLADPGPAGAGPQPSCRNAPCAGCGYGVAGKGLCSRHHDRWARRDRPDIGSWIARRWRRGRDLTPNAGCRSAPCGSRTPRSSSARTTSTGGRTAGCPDPDEYAADCRLRRHRAHRPARAQPPTDPGVPVRVAMPPRRPVPDHAAAGRCGDAIRQVQQAGSTRCWTYSEQQWRQAARSRLRERLFLIDAREAVETLRDGTGWEVEYPRDVWRLHKLPGITTGPGQSCRAAGCGSTASPNSGCGSSANDGCGCGCRPGWASPRPMPDVDALIRFSEFLTRVGVDTLAEIDRPLLERYLAWVNTAAGRARSEEDPDRRNRTAAPDDPPPRLGRHPARHRGPSSPATAHRRPERSNRKLAEHVMAQVESAAQPRPMARPGLPLDHAHPRSGAGCASRAPAPWHSTACSTTARSPLPALLQHQDEARGRRPDRRGTRNRHPLPATPGAAALARRQPASVPPTTRQRHVGAAPLGDSTYRRGSTGGCGRCEVHDEHGRPGPPDAAPMAPHLRLPADQPRRPARSGPESSSTTNQAG